MYVHPSHLRLANRRRLSTHLLAHGASSRAELARALGVSAVTAGKVVDELLREGVLEETDEVAAPEAGARDATPQLGRPARGVRLAAKPEFVAVEIGVARTWVRALDLGGRVGAERGFATPRSPAAFLREFERAATVAPGRLRAVLASVPGVVDEAAARVVFSPNLHWTEGGELLPALGRARRAPVVAVQEVHALALGLVAAGEAPDAFVLIDFGDGVGGAVVAGPGSGVDRMPLIGEIGHTRVPGNARKCGCGAQGCLETLAHRAGLLRSCREATGAARLDWDGLAARVAARGVEAWLAATIDAAAVVVAGAVNLLGVRDVVLLGDLPALHPDVLPRFAAELRRQALPARYGDVLCRAAPRRRMLGLAAAALDRLVLPAPQAAAPRAAAPKKLRSRA